MKGWLEMEWLTGFLGSNWIEISATLFGFACVALTVKQNIWCWPTGLVQVVLYIFVFYHAKLYSDLILHVIYIGLQFFGWYFWLHGGKNQTSAPVIKLSGINQSTFTSAYMWMAVTIFSTSVWGFIMKTWTDASLPYWDAFTTVASLIATYLMAKKVLESWLWWIAVDVVAIGVYFYKGLYPTTVLYITFLVMATMGYFSWKKSLKGQSNEENFSSTTNAID